MTTHEFRSHLMRKIKHGGIIEYYSEHSSIGAPREHFDSPLTLPSISQLTNFTLVSNLEGSLLSDSIISYIPIHRSHIHAVFHTFCHDRTHPVRIGFIAVNGVLYLNKQLVEHFLGQNPEELYYKIVNIYNKVRYTYLLNVENAAFDFDFAKVCCWASIKNLINSHQSLTLRDIEVTVNRVFNDSILGRDSIDLAPLGQKIVNSNNLYRASIAKLIRRASVISATSRGEGFQMGFTLIHALLKSGYVHNDSKNVFEKPVSIVPKICNVKAKWYNIPPSLQSMYTVNEMVFDLNQNANIVENGMLKFHISGLHPNASGDGRMCLGNENESAVRSLLQSGGSVRDYRTLLNTLETTLQVINYDSAYLGLSVEDFQQMIPHDATIELPVTPVTSSLEEHFEEI